VRCWTCVTNMSLLCGFGTQCLILSEDVKRPRRRQEDNIRRDRDGILRVDVRISWLRIEPCGSSACIKSG
jgi:hypothetical protein